MTVNFPPPPLGGFLLMTGAAFGYAAGWNPYASDYTRYLKPETNIGAGRLLRRARCVRLVRAARGRRGGRDHHAFGQQAGAASIGPALITDLLPTWLGKLTLLAIFLGAICANVLNIYSGSLSFMALGIQVADAGGSRGRGAACSGSIGSVSPAHYLNDPSTYENFLLIIAYWIGPWLAVVFLDRWFRRGSTRHRCSRARPEAPELGRPDRDGRRWCDLDLAVREPVPEVHRPDPDASSGVRRHHLRGRVRPVRAGLLRPATQLLPSARRTAEPAMPRDAADRRSQE